MGRVKKLIWIFSACLAWGVVPADTVTDRSALLEVARENLRVTEAAERRVGDEYESLYAAGALAAEEIEEYRGFLQRIRRFVERYRLEVAVLSGAAHAADQDEASVAPREDLWRSFSGEQTDEEQAGALDAELDASLGDFDEMLLREQQQLAEKARTAEAAAAGGGAGGGSAGAQGLAGNAAAASETFATQGDMSAGAPGAAAAAETGQRRVAAAGGYSGTGQRQGRSPSPADIPDGGDDDIVARQLREAAEKEIDAELRERLWDEYRKYKNATQ
jgi:hypothetical protein